MLRRVARGVADGDPRLSEIKGVAVLDLFDGESVFRALFAAAIDVCRIHPRAKFARTAHQIRMDVRFENVRDRHLPLTRQFHVFVDVGRRIEDGGYTRRIVTQQIRELSDSVGLNALKNQCHNQRVAELVPSCLGVSGVGLSARLLEVKKNTVPITPP